MHILVSVRSGDPQTGRLTSATECLMVFVAVDGDGRPVEVPAFEPQTDADARAQEPSFGGSPCAARSRAQWRPRRTQTRAQAPRVVLRFLAAPTDVNWGGKVHGGIVMRWIDEAAHVLATRWTGSAANVAVYAGGVRFYRPLRIGHLVEVDARLLHTGSTSMHISVHVRSGDPATSDMDVTTHCLIVFVPLTGNGQAAPAPSWTPVSDEDVALERHALHLVE